MLKGAANNWLPHAARIPSTFWNEAELVHKPMRLANLSALEGWLRTTWMTYAERIPEIERAGFVQEWARRVSARCTSTEHGRLLDGNQRLVRRLDYTKPSQSKFVRQFPVPCVGCSPSLLSCWNWSGSLSTTVVFENSFRAMIAGKLFDATGGSMSEHEQVTAMLSAKNAAPLELDPACTALIIVDMQRYFTQPSYPFTDLFEKMSPGVCSGYLRRVRENVIPSIRRLLDHFRKNGSLVVFTAVGTETQDGSDLAGWARALDEAGEIESSWNSNPSTGRRSELAGRSGAGTPTR